MPTKALTCGVVLFLLVLAAGCREPEGITRYTARRAERVRLLAAIFPHGEKSWVFRLSGPEGVVAPHAEAFERFLATVRFDDQGNPPIAWDLPGGWREEAGKDLRYKTIRIGPSADAPELTVTHLAGAQAGSVLDNVNRWRGQLGIGQIAEDDLPQYSRKLKLAGGEAILVDMSGRASARPPMVSATGRAPPTEPGGGPRKPPITYQKPDGWNEHRDPSGLAVAAFRVTDGNRFVDITVTPLPGGAGGLAANINRWRNQVGLESVGENDLRKDIREVDLAGMRASHVDLVGPQTAGSIPPRIVGLVLARAEATWFFKMRGPADLVARQEAIFETFVRSVRFE